MTCVDYQMIQELASIVPSLLHNYCTKTKQKRAKWSLGTSELVYACLPVRNGLVSEFEFLGLITQLW